MSRSGTNNTGMGTGAGTPMARTATNGSVAMARTGTNNSSIAGRTPVTIRAGRATSAGSTTTTTVGIDSPAVTAAAAMLMEGVMGGAGGSGAGGPGGGIIAKGLTPNDGAGLGIGMTPLGGAGGSVVSGLAGMAERDQEEERKRRLEVICEMVGGRWGWVGQEGVERCARRIGFECLWEEGMGTGEGKRVLSIAGEGVLIEVGFKDDEVADVGLSFPASQEDVGKWVGNGAAVLKKDLTGVTGSDDDGNAGKTDNDKGRRYVGLEPFVKNLQGLRRMDQLSGEAANCFDAVDGIFKSLDRIYEWELRPEGTGKAAETKITCSLGGRPQMHVNGSIGLMLGYWKDRRNAPTIQEEERLTLEAQIPKTWSVLMECEECLAEVYTPIRITDQWVSKEVSRAANQELDGKHISTSGIDWLDVPINVNGREAVKPVNIRFVARFEPPIIVPLQLALQICDSVSWPIDQTTVMPTTFESLVFADQDVHNPLQTSPRVVDQHSDSIPGLAGKEAQTHRLALYTQAADYAQLLVDIPFKHPMQIVNLLPVLRQWALVRSIMLRSFTPSKPKPFSHSQNGSNPITNGISHSAHINPGGGDEKETEAPAYQTLEEEFADFLSSPPTSITNNNNNNYATFNSTTNTANHNNEPPLTINVAFATTPLPHFNIQFPNPKYGGKLASVTFSVGLNGVIDGVDVDDGRPTPPLATDGDAHAQQQALIALREKVRKVLEIGESVGVLVEWLCRLSS